MHKKFNLKQTSGKARSGRFSTAHGDFDTPNFMPVGTQGTVKGVDVERLRESGAQIILVNTYHLWQRPGHELVEELGGIHKLSAWSGPILSDSGGYQVFSLQSLRKITEEGVEFRSHLDGRKLFLSPEKSIEIQESLGVDIAMVLDECPSTELDYTQVEKSLELTLGWARRSLQARKKDTTAVFGITQGGLHKDLRTRAVERLSELDFDGMAIGGLSVGEPIDEMYEVLSYHADSLPADKPRYLMGVGTPRDIVQAVSEGVDMFDCVIPTRSGRFGRIYITGETPVLNIKNACHKNDAKPLDESCSCVACRNYSRAYLHHLFKAEEMLGPQLASIHNLTHYLTLMQDIRSAINSDSFPTLYCRERVRWDNFRNETQAESEEEL